MRLLNTELLNGGYLMFWGVLWDIFVFNSEVSLKIKHTDSPLFSKLFFPVKRQLEIINLEILGWKQ